MIFIFINADELKSLNGYIFNDDKYDYATTGYPFLKNLGRVLYEYERTRVRKNKTDLTHLLFNYTN